ncbi:MAG: SDR family oxidoreductase, partial [Planctomycetes bacterium]|nr:SDR family oxidoreductase [Planctomycetota bacterium]
MLKALAVAADLCDPEQIENLFAQACTIDVPQILINSAAVFSRQRLEDVLFEQAQKVFNVNLTAPILTSQAFARIINDQFGKSESVVGKIINISDVGGIRPWAQYVLYCSSKAGLIGATKSLAKELAPSICVNSIAPGLVTWPEGFDDAKKQRQLSFVPAKRVAMLSEITSAIILMLENDYITGQVL